MICRTEPQSNPSLRKTVYDHAHWKKKDTHTLDFRTLTNVFAATGMESMAKQMRLSVTCRAREMTKRTVVVILQIWSISLVWVSFLWHQKKTAAWQVNRNQSYRDTSRELYQKVIPSLKMIMPHASIKHTVLPFSCSELVIKFESFSE